MLPYEYVFVLTSIIIGLGIAEILRGFSDLISSWKSHKISIAHLFYASVLFFLHIQEWYIEYSFFQNVKDWTLLSVTGILIFPLILFLQARLVFPTGNREQELDLPEYYATVWRRLFFLGVLGVTTSIANNLLVGYAWESQIPQFVYLTMYLVFLLFSIKNPKCHLAFNAAQLVVVLVYLITSTESL